MNKFSFEHYGSIGHFLVVFRGLRRSLFAPSTGLYNPHAMPSAWLRSLVREVRSIIISIHSSYAVRNVASSTEPRGTAGPSVVLTLFTSTPFRRRGSSDRLPCNVKRHFWLVYFILQRKIGRSYHNAPVSPDSYFKALASKLCRF
jgi:hypothetical protein